MWWNGQNLDKPARDKKGRLWHFRVWHDHLDGVYTQRIFFWDDEREEMGCAELGGGETLHVSKIKQRMRKIIADPTYRASLARQLRFPVERYYS